MASRAAGRLGQIDEAIAVEQAKIAESGSVLAENEKNRSEVIALHDRQETQRATLQAALGRAQLLHDLAIGSGAEVEKSQELLSAQNALALCEESISHNRQTSLQFNADYESASKQLQFDLALSGSQIEQLQSEKQELLRIRQESHEQYGLETQAAILSEIEALRSKEDRFERLATRARAERIAKQQSITSRLALWPSIARETEERYGHHEPSLRTSLLERWHCMVLEIEQHAGELSFETLFLEKFIDMRMVPIPSIASYGKRAAFAHRNWSEKPGPIAMFAEYVPRLEDLLAQWKSIDKKEATARNMQRATQQTPTL